MKFSRRGRLRISIEKFSFIRKLFTVKLVDKISLANRKTRISTLNEMTNFAHLKCDELSNVAIFFYIAS